MKPRGPSLAAVVAAVLAIAGAAARPMAGSPPRRAAPDVVIVPTLGTDHQFDLDYTVAHLAAVLDAVAPDAVIVEDYTDWLRADCVYQTAAPENHVAIQYARSHHIPIWGARDRPSPGDYEASLAAARRLSEQYATREAVERDYRRVLERTTARIAREFSFSPEPQTLRYLLRSGFAHRAAARTSAQQDAITSAGRSLNESVRSLVGAHPQLRRWAVVAWWGRAMALDDVLRTDAAIRRRPVTEFLTAADRALPARMDSLHISWILSGMLDEWYGMWAPQVFPTNRIAGLLRRLEALAPADPTTRFLNARRLMQNRDYSAAESILAGVVADAGDARFPFPVNGKWIRPPWSSVRRKAMLNLAFVYDLRGDRDGAQRLYRQILTAGDELDSEARAGGYLYDEIRSVIESYTQTPYTGLPVEAFRHYRLVAAVPACDPGRGPR
ncbi:MAG: hypothetical protein A3G21_03770 [Acidobacteria bacterium RIFCSPLOWO2_12_FULL_66_21]|nr:MAG: hypothetical protein A3G21_03770 [Acidobacteria bacterium RIFCSPLOWO2_12_FULL_66_21]